VAGKPGKSGPPAGNSNGVTHGYYSLRARLSGADLDKRTAAYKALAEKEQELITALGGDVSPQERIIIADTVKHLLFAASLDRYLMQLKSLVRKGKVHGVVSERTRIGAHIRDNLKTLGLAKRIKEVDVRHGRSRSAQPRMAPHKIRRTKWQALT
jgi:hypothetical protein